MGVAQVEILEKTIVAMGGRNLCRWPITYYKKNPCCLVASTWTYLATPMLELDGKDDQQTPYLSIEGMCQRGGIVYDCCVGRGLIAESAVKLGRVAYGNELNPRRLAVTLKKVSKLVGQNPVKVGELHG